jgi:Ala-tRNA(Pro) deacylase
MAPIAMNAQLGEFLTAHLVKYTTLTHREAFTAQEEAAAAHVSGHQWAKVVLVKKEDGYVLAVLPACCRIDLTRLQGLLGQGGLSLATAEEIRQACAGFEPGAVPPFGRLFGMAVLVDASLLGQPEVLVPGGDHRTAVRLRTTEFLRVAEPHFGAFAVHEGAPAQGRS